MIDKQIAIFLYGMLAHWKFYQGLLMGVYNFVFQLYTIAEKSICFMLF